MAKFDVKTFKVAYYKSEQPNILYSKFFDAFEDALSFSKTLPGPYLIARKYLQSGDEFSWELMPYGAYSDYRISTSFMEYKWLILGVAAVVVYILFNMRSSNATAPKIG